MLEKHDPTWRMCNVALVPSTHVQLATSVRAMSKTSQKPRQTGFSIQARSNSAETAETQAHLSIVCPAVGSTIHLLIAPSAQDFWIVWLEKDSRLPCSTARCQALLLHWHGLHQSCHLSYAGVAVKGHWPLF